MVKADALLDGPEMTIEFAKSKFLAIDDKSGSPSTVLKMKQKPSDIVFMPGTLCSAWEPIQEMFKTSLTVPAMIDWEEGAQIYTRWALKMSNSFQSKSAGLVLQCLILPEKLEMNPPPSREVFNTQTAMYLNLWDMEVEWSKPLLSNYLPTSPGLFMVAMDDQPMLTDNEVRANLALLLLSSLDGIEAITAKQMKDWLNQPVGFWATDTPSFPVVPDNTDNPTVDKGKH